LLFAVVALMLSGCTFASNKAAYFRKPKAWGGVDSISGSRLYLDEVRFYVQEFVPALFGQTGFSRVMPAKM